MLITSKVINSIMETNRRQQESEARIETIDFVYPIEYPYGEERRRKLNFIWRGFTTLAEEYTPNSSGSHHAWKSFEHWKCTAEMPAMQGSFKLTDYAWTNGSSAIGVSCDPIGPYEDQFGNAGSPNIGLHQHYAKRSLDGGFVPPPEDLDRLIAASLRQMLPAIKPELSSINSIIELKDFRSLPSTILHCKDVFFRKGASLLLQGRSTLRQYLRASSDGYLQAKFNILPLLSDINGVYTALVRIEGQLADLLNRAGRRQCRHFRAFLAESPASVVDEPPARGYSLSSPFEGDWPYHYAGWNISFKRTAYTRPAEFHAQISYTYDYSAFQREHARVLAILDAFGVNLNPAIIWNAVKWTFVIDWLLGVSSWLKSFKIDNMAPRINIHGYLWSIKRHRLTTIDMTLSCESSYEGFSPPIVTKRTLPVTTERSYRRCVTPLPASAIVAGGLDLTEFSLASALVLSRGRKPKYSLRPWLGRLVSKFTKRR